MTCTYSKIPCGGIPSTNKNKVIHQAPLLLPSGEPLLHRDKQDNLLTPPHNATKTEITREEENQIRLNPYSMRLIL